MNWRLIAVFFTLVSVFAGASAQQHLNPTERDLPAFELDSVQSGVWNEDKLEGKTWVINFWATWCPPCIEEIPSMNAAWDVLEKENVGMLAINAGEGEVAVKNFLNRIAIDFPTLMGDGDSLANWSVRALPTTIIVNAEGKVVYEALGPREWDDKQLLDKVLELL